MRQSFVTHPCSKFFIQKSCHTNLLQILVCAHQFVELTTWCISRLSNNCRPHTEEPNSEH